MITMAIPVILAAFLFASFPREATAFSVAPIRSILKPLKTLKPPKPHPSHLRARSDDFSHGVDDDSSPPSDGVGDDDDASVARGDGARTRRSVLQRGMLAAASTAAATAATGAAVVPTANAALGTLPELADTNAVIQSLTVDVTDKSQYEETIEFFTSAFDGMKVLRERNGGGGGVKDTWLGFGPETLSIPPDFELPVSAPSQYGGHAALHLRYDPLSTTPLYVRSAGEFNDAPAPGDNIAYLQLGVPQYRISLMVKCGGNVLDGFGWVEVVSPAGLPVRAIVGVTADPIMLLAVNCNDAKKSEEFYASLGFVRQEYPYARLNQGQGQFEPPQPPKSIYVSPSPNSMGILLLQNARRKRKTVLPNPVVRSLNVVYAPPEGDGDDGGGAGGPDAGLVDPSAIPISFVPQDSFEREIKATTAAVRPTP